MPGSCLVALLCTLAIASICFFLYGDHIHEAYSKLDLTKLLYRGTKLCLNCLVVVHTDYLLLVVILCNLFYLVAL